MRYCVLGEEKAVGRQPEPTSVPVCSLLDTGSRAEHRGAGMTRENDPGARPVRTPEQSLNHLQMGFCAFLLGLQTDLLGRAPTGRG